VREAGSDDIGQIISLLVEGFPNIPPDQWRNIFEYTWCKDKPNLGFVLVDGAEIVGFIGSIYADREIDGQRQRFCNGTAWYVRPAYRAHSTDLLLSFVDQPGFTITALTPNPVSRLIMEALDFQVLDRFTRFVPPLLQAHTLLRGTGVRVLTTTEDIKPHLSAPELRILLDHERYACRHYLALCKQGYCYIVTRSKVRRGIRISEILYASDHVLMMRHFEKIKLRILLSERALLLMVDERKFGERCPLSLRRPNPRYFISETLSAGQIDNLYTEYVLLPKI
jgi:acetoacetyl-CoA synthetase